jgi:hypothetical protein
MSNSAEEKGRFPESQSIEYAMTLIAVIWGPSIMVFGYRIGMPLLSPLVYVLVCFGRLKFLKLANSGSISGVVNPRGQFAAARNTRC